MPPGHEQDSLLERLISALERAGIPYMLSGGLSAIAYGRPRTTFDVDLVIEADERAVERLAEALGGGFEMDVESARRAARMRDECNVIDFETMEKADLWWLTETEFDRSRFSRKRLVPFPGGKMYWLPSPEDVILQKLLWRRKGGGENQIYDAAGVISVMGPDLDRAYLEGWAERMGLRDFLDEAQRCARKPER